jgi:peroxiredoxin
MHSKLVSKPKIGQPAARFEAELTPLPNKPAEFITNETFRGLWLVLIFYRFDEELLPFSTNVSYFRDLKANILSVSDNVYTNEYNFMLPIVLDPNLKIWSTFGVLNPCYFLIDPSGMWGFKKHFL